MSDHNQCCASIPHEWERAAETIGRLYREVSRGLTALVERLKPIVAALISAYKRGADSSGAYTSPTPTPLQSALLPRKQLAVWEALDGRRMHAWEIAEYLGMCRTSEDAIRKRIQKIRKLRLVIRHTPGAGYWRPDAPPTS